MCSPSGLPSPAQWGGICNSSLPASPAKGSFWSPRRLVTCASWRGLQELRCLGDLAVLPSQPPAAEFSRVPRSGFLASQAQPTFPVSQGIHSETPSNADSIHSLFCSLCLHVAILLNAASRHWGYNFHQVDRVQTTCSTRLPSSVIPQQSTREGRSRGQDEVPAVCLSGAAVALAPIEVIFSLFRATLWPQTPKKSFHFTCLSIKSFR